MTFGEKIAALLAALGVGVLAVAALRSRKPATRTAPGESAAPDFDGTPTAAPPPVSDNHEALARAIASEAGGEPRAVQLAVGWAVRNESTRRKVSLFRLIAPSGKYGPQSTNGYVASGRAATAATRTIAAIVIHGREPDPTGGATQFDSPRAQRALLAQGRPGYRRTPEDVARARRADGKVVVILPGIPEDQFRLWRRA